MLYKYYFKNKVDKTGNGQCQKMEGGLFHLRIWLVKGLKKAIPFVYGLLRRSNDFFSQDMISNTTNAMVGRYYIQQGEEDTI